jgi:D-arabinose 1-dehydrogenase-like Zn-dependent alcohol dehydrogenase
MTAYYSLVMRGRLRKGMRVLIHSGTGAVGLAAIQICLRRGAEVKSSPHPPLCFHSTESAIRFKGCEAS